MGGRRQGAVEESEAGSWLEKWQPQCFFFSAPGSVHRATQSGTWGDAREATAEFGERYLAAVTRGTLRLLDDIERTFAAMPPRSSG